MTTAPVWSSEAGEKQVVQSLGNLEETGESKMAEESNPAPVAGGQEGRPEQSASYQGEERSTKL